MSHSLVLILAVLLVSCSSFEGRHSGEASGVNFERPMDVRER